MKKFWIIIFTFILLLAGCSNHDEVEDDANYNLEAKYNVVYGDMGVFKFMDYSEDTILAFPPSQSMAEFGSSFLSGYLYDDQFYVMETDTSSSCSLYNAGACEGIFYTNARPVYYYKGKLYALLVNEYNAELNKYETVIKRYDLDGRNSETLMKVDTNNVNLFGDSISSSLQFHKNKIYLTAYDSLFIANLKDKEMKKVEMEGVSKIFRIILNKDILYVAAEQYNDGSKAHFNVVLECDLDGNDKNLLYEDKKLQFIDDRFLFYTENQNDTYFTSMLDRNSGDTKPIDGKLYNQILKYEDSYLLDVDYLEQVRFIVLNNKGEIIGEKEENFTTGNYAQLYLGNRYYVAINLGDKQVTSEYGSGTVNVIWFGYYEITEDGISDLIMLEMPKE